jgi:uncharacterized protein YraI
MKKQLSLLSLLMAFVVVLSACGSASTTAAEAKITSPTARQEFAAGDTVKIMGTVSGSGVAKARLFIDNQAVAETDQPTEGSRFDFAADFPLPAAMLGGSTVIELKGVAADDSIVVSSEPVFIVVRGAPTATPPPPPPTPVPTAVVAPEPTAAVPVTATAATTGSVGVSDDGGGGAVAGNSVLNKDNLFVNVRKGPALTFEIVGQFKQNATAKVVGKSEDGAWWQVEGEGVSGWMFGQLLQFTGDAAKVPAIKVAIPTAAPAAVQPTAAVVAIAPTAAPQPTTAPAAVLPYSQSDSFAPRNDIGDVPVGHNGESNSSKWVWTVNGARSAEVEITTGTNEIYDCPAGNLGGISPNSAAGKRLPVTLPSGEFPFTITEKGSYIFTLHVTKADGSQTTIPRWVIYGCYKKPGR